MSIEPPFEDLSLPWPDDKANTLVEVVDPRADEALGNVEESAEEPIVPGPLRLVWTKPEPTFEDTFHAIFDQAFGILVERQRKYGPENVRSLGTFGVFSRLAFDKIERIKRAMNGRVEHGEIVLEETTDFGDESFEDALFDVANYALILVALRRGVWGRPLAKP